MEVTTMTPSPASPTEGDDLCEIDAINVALDGVTLLICLCGLVGNRAVLWLFGSHCFSRNSNTLYILILTFVDFLILLFLVSASLLFLLEDVSCSVIMPLLYVWVLSQLSLLSYSTWLYLLTFISIQKCRSIHCPLWHCCHRPQHLSKVVCALLWTFSISVISLFATVASLCASQLSEHCRVSLISIHTFNLLLCVPFILISITVLYLKIMSCSHQKKPKRLDIVICLSVFLTLPFSLRNLLQGFGYTILSSHLAFLLTCIYSTIKPFISFLVGRCWKYCSLESLQLSLQRIFEEKKERTAGRNDASRDTSLLIPSTALLKDLGIGFLEPPFSNYRWHHPPCAGASLTHYPGCTGI